MDKHIYDSKNNLWYELQSDYHIPCIAATETQVSIGVWGSRRQRYLTEHKKGLCTAMLLPGKLPTHLQQTDEQANRTYSLLTQQHAAQAGITELLKAVDEVAWVQQMNSIRTIAAEIVREELIYALFFMKPAY